jgi:hypothetical protein
MVRRSDNDVRKQTKSTRSTRLKVEDTEEMIATEKRSHHVSQAGKPKAQTRSQSQVKIEDQIKVETEVKSESTGRRISLAYEANLSGSNGIGSPQGKVCR